MKFVRRFIVLIGGAFNGLFVLLLIATAYSPYIDPTVHPMWSCLGLAFPVFLLTDIAFLLLWIIVRQYKMALLPLAGLLLCYGQIRTYIPLNFPAEHVPEGSLKILSYNIMGFNSGKKTDGENAILAYLQHSGADILCLQEFATYSSPRLTKAEVDQALDNYPYQRVDKLGSADISTNYIACYSKYPILSARKLNYASDGNGQAGVYGHVDRPEERESEKRRPIAMEKIGGSLSHTWTAGRRGGAGHTYFPTFQGYRMRRF